MARLGVKVAAVLAVAFTLAGCGTDRPTQGLAGTAAGGYFTLTGIPEEHEGRFVFLSANDGNLSVEGWQSFNPATYTAVISRIAGGRARLPMWVFAADGIPVRWYGSMNADIAVVLFMEEGELAGGDAANPEPLGGLFFRGLVFTGGNAQRSFADGMWNIWE